MLVVPGDPVWIDVWIPRADPLWHEDVGRAFDWLGHTWVRALETLGVHGVSAHGQGALATTRWSGLVCFGGVGAGEVVTATGSKVVGLAQRRNRDGALFHGACVLYWDAQPLVALLALSDPDRAAAGRHWRRPHREWPTSDGPRAISARCHRMQWSPHSSASLP